MPIFLGRVVAWVVQRVDRSAASIERRGEPERTGLLAAAGFITGEALLGSGLAVPVALEHDENAIALFDGRSKDFTSPAQIFVGLVMVLLYKLALRKSEKPV